MADRETEADRLHHVVSAMPAGQALSYLAHLVIQGGTRERGEIIAALLLRFAATLDAEMAFIRDGIPVVSHDDEVRTFREYGVRTPQTYGRTGLTNYGDRLFAAVNDATRTHEAEVVSRDVVVGPWQANVLPPT